MSICVRSQEGRRRRRSQLQRFNVADCAALKKGTVSPVLTLNFVAVRVHGLCAQLSSCS